MKPSNNSPDWVRDLWGRIAIPRPPGSTGVREVESVVAEHLARSGWTVRWQDFKTSPKRLYAVGVGATGLGWWALVMFPLLVTPVSYATVVSIAVGLASAIGVVVFGVGRYGWGRWRGRGLKPNNIDARNLVATKGKAPSVWLVAHFDSKAQRASMAGRIISVITASLGFGVLTAQIAWRIDGVLQPVVVLPGLLLCVFGAYRLTGPPLVGDSPGAVDNASGIIAVLAAAKILREREDIAILITGAEEFGMEGARYFVSSGLANGRFVNFDGIDGSGTLNLMPHPGLRNSWVRGLADAIGAAWKGHGGRVRNARLPVGVFVDGGILARGGMQGVTVARGAWNTLRVVHTPDDRPDRLDPKAVAEVGEIVGKAIGSIFG